MSEKRTVLAIDDTPENLRLVEALLVPQGYAVVTASSGKEALAALPKTDPDLILVDLVMPEMNGFDVTKAIRADDATRHIPIIVITATGGADLVRALDAGADDFVAKPFDKNELLARVKSLIRVKSYHDDLADALERQTAVGDVLREVGSATIDATPVFRVVSEHAARLCRADNVGMWRREGDLFHLAATTFGVSSFEAYAREHPQDLRATGVVGRAARLKQSVVIPDLDVDPDYPPEALAELRKSIPAKQLLGVPMLLDGEVIGVISVVWGKTSPVSAREIELIETFAEQAALAVNNVRLFQTVERQREELSRYLSPQIGALITSQEGKRLLDGHRRAVTIVFCDFRGFTPFSETVEPEEVLAVLRMYHKTMGELIAEHGGTLEHFEGDGMMVFFNDPIEVADHELRAVRMAMAMRERFAEISAPWRKKGYDLGLGFGIAVGYATLGRIGYEGRYDYAAIGNVTILAQRLSAKAEAGQILVSQRLNAAVEDRVETAPIGELELKGISRPVSAFSVTRAKA
ncbi:MAG TPA: response regulator [Candidatus Limnocylindria bacterium]|nr:response regulator [Candidatus Limnocylindria bacterium]